MNGSPKDEAVGVDKQQEVKSDVDRVEELVHRDSAVDPFGLKGIDLPRGSVPRPSHWFPKMRSILAGRWDRVDESLKSETLVGELERQTGRPWTKDEAEAWFGDAKNDHNWRMRLLDPQTQEGKLYLWLAELSFDDQGIRLPEILGNSPLTEEVRKRLAFLLDIELTSDGKGSSCSINPLRPPDLLESCDFPDDEIYIYDTVSLWQTDKGILETLKNSIRNLDDSELDTLLGGGSIRKLRQESERLDPRLFITQTESILFQQEGFTIPRRFTPKRAQRKLKEFMDSRDKTKYWDEITGYIKRRVLKERDRHPGSKFPIGYDDIPEKQRPETWRREAFGSSSEELTKVILDPRTRPFAGRPRNRLILTPQDIGFYKKELRSIDRAVRIYCRLRKKRHLTSRIDERIGKKRREGIGKAWEILWRRGQHPPQAYSLTLLVFIRRHNLYCDIEGLRRRLRESGVTLTGLRQQNRRKPKT